MTPAFNNTKPAGKMPLKAVRDADHRAFGDIRVARNHLLHAASREPVPRDIDDVVGAGHHEHIAVSVDIASIRGLIIAWIFCKIALDEAFIVLPERGQAAGRHRQPDQSAPVCPGFTSSLLSFRTRNCSPASGTWASRVFTGAAPGQRHFRQSPRRSRFATNGRSPAPSTGSSAHCTVFGWRARPPGTRS